MRRVLLVVLMVACGKSERKGPPLASAKVGSDSAVVSEATNAAVPPVLPDEPPKEDVEWIDTPRPSLPAPKPLPPPPPRSAAPQLRLVGCGPAPEPPVMRVGDPDVPGTPYGYHTGAPPNTPYQRQPFGLPPQPLAKPYIWSSLSSDRHKIRAQLDAVLKPHEDNLAACYAKALADQTQAQHRMIVQWTGSKVTARIRGDDLEDSLLDEEAAACVARVLGAIQLPADVQRGVDHSVVSLHASRLQPMKQPPKKLRKKENELGFGYAASGFGPNGHGTRAREDGWTGYRLGSGMDDDGAALAPHAVATIKPKLPAIARCLRALKPRPLTGSLRGVVEINGYGGPPTTLTVYVAGLGDPGSDGCFWDALMDIPLARSIPPSDHTKRLVCDFTWGAPQPLRATSDGFHSVLRVHATDIEYLDERYTPADDLPHRRYPMDSALVIADPDAPGSLINAALDFASGVDYVMLAVQKDSGPPFFVGRAAHAGFSIPPGAHVGFQQSGGQTARCDDACKAHSPCAGAWIGIGDDNVGADLLALRAETERAGYSSAAVGRRPCK